MRSCPDSSGFRKGKGCRLYPAPHSLGRHRADAPAARHPKSPPSSKAGSRISATSGAIRRRRWKPTGATCGNSSPSSPSISAGAPSLKDLARSDARRRARLPGRAPRRRHRQPFADALARRRARLRALSGAQRQGQGRRARRGAGAENRQDPAAAARRPPPPSAWPTPISRPATNASRGSTPATPPCWRCSTAAALRISEALGLKRGDFGGGAAMPSP